LLHAAKPHGFRSSPLGGANKKNFSLRPAGK
jgi:hypothetical protein